MKTRERERSVLVANADALDLARVFLLHKGSPCVQAILLAGYRRMDEVEINVVCSTRQLLNGTRVLDERASSPRPNLSKDSSTQRSVLSYPKSGWYIFVAAQHVIQRRSIKG